MLFRSIGGGPRVRVLDGLTLEVIRDTFVYESTFRGGVSVAAGDVNGDGTPDVITSAKGLANGLPIGLTAARADVADSVKKMTISTFGGNPVSTAAAKAVLDLIEEERLAENAAETGAYLRARLEELKDKHALIGDVRGMGLMQGIELVEDRKTKAPATAAALRLMEAARENRILIGRGGLEGNVLRISPPLNITRGDVDAFVNALDASLTKAASV